MTLAACSTRRRYRRPSRSARTGACERRTRRLGSIHSPLTASIPSRASWWRRIRSSRNARARGRSRTATRESCGATGSTSPGWTPTTTPSGSTPPSWRRKPRRWASGRCSSTMSASPTSRGNGWQRQFSRRTGRGRPSVRRCGVPVTFDIFGLTASVTTGDLGIGQVWEDFVSVADVVLPMVYPSHYYKGSYGLAWPNGEPYRVVRNALSEALDRSRPLSKAATIRPYLQAFTLGRRTPRYTPHEIREQIRAAEELGINTWVLWNPRSVYQRDSLRPYRVQLATVTDGPQ